MFTIICLDLGLFMSRPCYLFFIFIIIFTMINLMNTDPLVLFLIFYLECALLFLDDNVDVECEEKQKFSLSVLLSICLIFDQFQHSVAYKCVAY